MSNEWLAAGSSEHINCVLAAINALSIHMKLKMIGKTDDASTRQVEEAKKRIGDFLDSLSQYVGQISSNDNGAVMGADLRTNAITKRFVQAAMQEHGESPLYQLTLRQVKELISSDGGDNPQQLVLCLRDLRALLEQDAGSDTDALRGGL